MTSFARLGKSFIRSITGVQENYKKEEYVEQIDYSVCKECPFFALDSSLKEDYCNNYCNKPRKIVVKTTYYNEANRYHIPVRERLSKSQLKQLMLYHFFGVDRNGIIKNISVKEVARLINCDVKTVRNNNDRFVELNYIIYSNSSNDEFSAILTDYKKYHLTKNEGGSGYVTISKELFNELLDINTVNSLRLELRKLIEFDNKNIGAKNVQVGKYSYRDIKRFLPGYLHYRGAIEDVIKNGTNSFETIINRDGIEFKLKDDYNPDILRSRILDDCYNQFDEYFDKFDFTEDNLVDIYQMSLQYGIDRVKYSLSEICKDYIENNKYILNLGGLVRRIIERQKAS